MPQLLTETTLDTQYGTFRLLLYSDGQMEIPVLVMGDVRNREHVLMRMHSMCINGHYFNSTECDCAAQMAETQACMVAAGIGIIILMPQEGKGNGYLALLKSKPFKQQGMTQAQAYVAAGFRTDARDYTAAAHILRDLGAVSIVLMSENKEKRAQLEECGVLVL